MNKFEKLLEDRGITRYALSQKSGVPQSVLQRLKDGGKIETLSFLTCIKLAKALNMRTDELYEELKDNAIWVLVDGWNDLDLVSGTSKTKEFPDVVWQ